MRSPHSPHHTLRTAARPGDCRRPAASATAIAIAGQLPASATGPVHRIRNIRPGASGSHPAPAPKLTNLAHLDWLLDNVPLLRERARATPRTGRHPNRPRPRRGSTRTATPTARSRMSAAARSRMRPRATTRRARSTPTTSRARPSSTCATGRRTTPRRASSTPTNCCASSPTCRRRPARTRATSCSGSSMTARSTRAPSRSSCPNPSDSAESFWLARTVWALGEGYAGFKTADPAFAQFLKQRMALALGCARTPVAREVRHDRDRERRESARLDDRRQRERDLGGGPRPQRLREGRAGRPHGRDRPRPLRGRNQPACRAAASDKWPFGAILPEENSPTFWHAWGGMEPAALSTAATVLRRGDYQQTAAVDTAQFTAQLLATGGPDNGWTPTPADQTQIAYGVDSRVEGLLAVADATHASRARPAGGRPGGLVLRSEPGGRARLRPGDRCLRRRNQLRQDRQPQLRSRVDHPHRAVDAGSGCASRRRPDRHVAQPHHRDRRADRRRSRERNAHRLGHGRHSAVGLDRFGQLVGRQVCAGGCG